MQSRSAVRRYGNRTFVVVVVAWIVTTFVVSGTHAKIPTLTPTSTPTTTPAPTFSPTPTATVTTTPGPTLTPTPVPPVECTELWPQTLIVTVAKGQSPANNAKLSHTVIGHIVDPGSLSQTAHRIEVCAGTEVNVAVLDTSGPNPTNRSLGTLDCFVAGCSGVVNVTEKYQSTSSDGRDTDRITFIPK